MEWLTKRESLKKMYNMWTWMADETERKKCFVSKLEYFIEVGSYGKHIPRNECYACENAFLECFEYFEGSIDDRELDDEMCNFCPVKKWRDCPEGCVPMYSPYYKWAVLGKRNWQDAAKYAREIAALAQEELDRMDKLEG